MRNVTQTAFLMAILTLVSKLFGFVREMVMAALFGTNYITDAYVMAVNIPSIIFAGIFGSIATAYMPLFSEIEEKKGLLESNRFTSRVLNILLIVSICSSIIGIIFSNQIVAIFANGFEGETAALTSFFVKITFSYVIFSATAEILEAFLQYRGLFLPQIWVGYSQNVLLICVIVVSAYYNYYLLAFGWLFAYALRFFVMFLFAKKKRYEYSLDLKVNQEVRNIFNLALPVFIGSSISQINTFVDKILASGLPEGSVSALNYSMLIITMIAHLTTSILVTLIYPKLTQANALNDIDRLSTISAMGMNITILFALPCTLGAMVYSNQIVQMIYERGAFDGAATSLTGSAFFYYSAGILFTALNTLVVKVYYSMHDMKTPIYYAAFGVIINIALNLILVRYMAINGLALATSISIACSTIFLYTGLRRKYKHINMIRSKGKIYKIIAASIIAIGCSYIAYILLESLIPLAGVISMMIAAVITAAIVYLLLLKAFRVEEVDLINDLIKGLKK